MDEGGRKGATVKVYKNGTRIESLDGSRKFEFELDLDAQYVLSFEKEGYITKKIEIDTRNIPEERKEYPFEWYTFQVVLFPQVDDVNTTIYNQPVGKIRFSPDMDEIGRAHV